MRSNIVILGPFGGDRYAKVSLEQKGKLKIIGRQTALILGGFAKSRMKEESVLADCNGSWQMCW